MSKVRITCNHCGEYVLWYMRSMQEAGMIKIDNKIYCENCINTISHVGVDI